MNIEDYRSEENVSAEKSQFVLDKLKRENSSLKNRNQNLEEEIISLKRTIKDLRIKHLDEFCPENYY